MIVSRHHSHFATDPARWFIERRVGRVSFVRGSSDDSPPDNGPDVPTGPLADGDGPLRFKWSRSPLRTLEAGRVRHFDTGASIWLRTPSQQVDWLLAPYVHRPPARGVHAFLECLRKNFGPHCSIKEIAEQSRTVSGSTSLRRCYDAIWSDHNFVSMALYSGPFARTFLRTFIAALFRAR
jgi:hypothetical protein